MFKLRVKLSKKIKKLEINIVDFKDHIKFLERSNKMSQIKLGMCRSKSRKCEIGDSLKIKSIVCMTP